VNRALKRISIAILAMFLLLLINVNYLQGFETSSLASEPYNVRTLDSQFQYERGPITTSDGVTIAESKPTSGQFKYQRDYPDGPVYAPVTGYSTIFGTATGIEGAENDLLNGSGSSLEFRNLIDMITDKPRKGAMVETTINSKAQIAAYDGLKASGHSGGLVAIDPQTGAILALATYPSYDPNPLASQDGTTVDNYDKQLLDNPSNPLLDRALEATYPPGSTFKIVTSSTYFTSDSSNGPNSIVDSPTTLTLPQTLNVLHNDNDTACGNGSGHTTLIQAFAESCDTTFGNLGMDLGAQSLNSMAEAFGMNSSNLTIPLPVASSNYSIPPSLALTAYSAIGQYNDTVTPLQEAMFAATIANGGKEMKPYLVQQITASDLSVVQSATPSVLSTPISAAVANQVAEMMTAVVQDPDGTAYAFNSGNEGGLVIAGKTGTAQNGVNNTNLNDAVFTCFAPADNPQIAVGVIVDEGGYGAAAAAPIAVNVIKAYLGSR
jgi:penicillin-binding protein A